MRQQVYLIYNNYTKYITDNISDNIFVNRTFFSEELAITNDILYSCAQNTHTEYFYILRPSRDIIFHDFDFTFTPPEWDKEYIHVWNNDPALMLFNKDMVLSNRNYFSEDILAVGNVNLKSIMNSAIEYKSNDIIFLSYDEFYSDQNYQALCNRFPRAKRIHGVTGIFEAHMAAAKLAETNMFYVVDADAIILDSFEFDYIPQGTETRTVHVWTSVNPVNDLKYGYGGVKLFPTQLLRNYKGSTIDFAISVSNMFKVMPEISNITNFNTDPYSAWRSAFRECTKLSSGIMPGYNSGELEERLHVWCTKGADREFGEFVIMGANDGTEFGKKYAKDPTMLSLINDYKWLENRFTS